MSARLPMAEVLDLSWPYDGAGEEPPRWSEVRRRLRRHRHHPNERIDLPRCQLGRRGVQVLADRALRGFRHLRSLNLRDNSLGPFGAAALAERGLRFCPSLESLDLENNGIGDTGAEALAVGLGHCAALTRICLPGNEIGNVGIAALATCGLANIEGFRTLGVGDNLIGDAGVEVLAKERLASLQQIVLSKNRIGDRGVLALARYALQRWPKLMDLHLESNSFSEGGSCRFATEISENPPTALKRLTGIELREHQEVLNLPGGFRPAYAGAHQLQNRVILDVLQRYPTRLRRRLWANPELAQDKTFMVSAVSFSGRALQDASERLRDDKELVLAAVKQDGAMIAYASAALKGDREVGLAAVVQNGNLLRYASEALKGDRDVVLAAVKQSGLAICYASITLRGDKDVVLAAVRQWRYALRYASLVPRGNKEVMLAAVKQWGYALEYASDGLRGNKEVVITAVTQDARVLQFASEQLKGDKDVVLAALKRSGRAIKYASSTLRADKEVILAAVESSGNCPLNGESVAEMWASIESCIDRDFVRRVRDWSNEKHGRKVAGAMTFAEAHAQYSSYPQGSAEDRARFSDLGWFFLKTLDVEEEEEENVSDREVALSAKSALLESVEHQDVSVHLDSHSQHVEPYTKKRRLATPDVVV